MTLAEALAARRDALKITQRQLQTLLERRGVRVSANSISRWHTGQSAPRRGHLLILLDVLDVPIAERDEWKLMSFAVGTVEPTVDDEDVGASVESDGRAA